MMKAVPWEAFNKLQSVAPKLGELSAGNPQLNDVHRAVRDVLDGVMPFEKVDITDLGIADATLKNIQAAMATGREHPEPFRAALRFLEERGHPVDDGTESVAVKAVPSEALSKLQSLAPKLDEVSGGDRQLLDVRQAVRGLLDGVIPPEKFDLMRMDFPDGVLEAVSVAAVLSRADAATVRATQRFLDERGITMSDSREPSNQGESEDDLDDDNEQEAAEELTRSLARLTGPAYDFARKDAAKALGLRLETLDSEVRSERKRLERKSYKRITYYLFAAFVVIIAILFTAA